MRRTLSLLVLFTCVHAALWLVAFAYAWAATMAQFDNPDAPDTFGASFANMTVSVLSLPLLPLWTRWASENLPNLVEWVLFFANSALWGVLAVGMVRFLRSRRNRSLSGESAW